jgi:hypothetical protein
MPLRTDGRQSAVRAMTAVIRVTAISRLGLASEEAEMGNGAAWPRFPIANDAATQAFTA